MGAYLSVPHTGVESESGTGNSIQYAVGSMQGWRKTQEDAHIACTDLSMICDDQKDGDINKNMSAFGVFDGHGGKEVSLFVADRLLHELHQLPSFQNNDYKASLKEIYHRLDDLLLEPENVQVLNEYRVRKNPSEGGVHSVKSNTPLIRRSPAPPSPSTAPAGVLTAVSPSPTVSKDDSSIAYQNAIVAVPTPSSSSSVVSDGIATNNNDENEDNEDNESSTDKKKSTSISAATAKLLLKKIMNRDQLGMDDMEQLLAAFDQKDKDREGQQQQESATETDDASHNANSNMAMQSEETAAVTPPPVSLSPAPGAGGAAAIRTVPVHSVSRKVGANRTCLLPNQPIHAGCTAVFALLHHSTNKLYIANAGDSRAVLCRSGQAIALSYDHKPTDATERARIEAAGGFVSAVGRINNNLNLSRSIGDLKYKQVQNKGADEQLITAEPDIMIIDTIPEQDEFMILACDGVWDVLTNQEICHFVRERLTKFDEYGQPSSLFDPVSGVCLAAAKEEEEARDRIRSEDYSEVEEPMDTAGEASTTSNSDSTAAVCNYSLTRIVNDVCHRCLAVNASQRQNGIGTDNMTCIVVVFDRFLERIQKNDACVRLNPVATTTVPDDDVDNSSSSDNDMILAEETTVD